MIVHDFAENAAGVVGDPAVADAERHDALGVAHPDGLHRMDRRVELHPDLAGRPAGSRAPADVAVAVAALAALAAQRGDAPPAGLQ
jgi:hypothetical protein